MNRAARTYLGLVAARNIGVAVLLIIEGSMIKVGKSYGVVFSILSPWQWAWVFGTVGVSAVLVQFRPTVTRTRGLIIASSALALWWSLSILYGAAGHHWASGITALLWAMLAAKDTVFASQPLLSTDTEKSLRGLR